MQIPQPPNLDELHAGTKLIAGLGVSTIIPDIDFETYSPAGFVWNAETNKFDTLPGAQKKGLFTVGAARYTEHPEAEVLSLAYDLKNRVGRQLWKPGWPLPSDLFDHLCKDGLIEAWNVGFEYWVWMNICIPKYNFPLVSREQWRCAMAKARAFGLPGSLDAAGNVLNISNKKNKDGKRLLDKFSIPRNPTKTDTRMRILCKDDLQDAELLYSYNLQDIMAESEISRLTPDLSPTELEFWQCDQAINVRGVQVDQEAIAACMSIVEQAHAKYNAELTEISGNVLTAASEIQRLRMWMKSRGVHTDTLDAERLAQLLAQPEGLPDDVRRALEIRDMIGSAAVKKLYSMQNQITKDSRLHDLFIYHSARTGRAAGAGPQPQNLPNSGPETIQCRHCDKHYIYGTGMDCPWCGEEQAYPTDIKEWNSEAVENALTVIKSGSLECVEYFFKDAIAAVSGCLRGLFISAPGHDLICSDYSAIEAVVLAALADEQWRLDVFNTHGKIYEMSASKITGVDFDEYILYKSTTGSHHPDRKKIGKVAELASGYQGWIGAWKAFGADEFFSDEEIKRAILAWRAASPAIVEFWGGQERNYKTEYFGLEGAAIQAVLSPGDIFMHRGIKYLMRGDVLYCQLLSGRFITYHRPRLSPAQEPRRGLSLSFEGWNTNPKYGAMGWQRMNTYGGKLTENVVQATARDILAHAIVQLEKRDYPVVLHVHDEICSEIPEGFGSVEEFENILCDLPAWCRNWPIRASGGWRGKQYRK